MTAKLNLRLYKDLRGATASAGAVTQIYAIDAAGERDYARDRRDLVIPAGYMAEPFAVDLQPGKYVVEARLPSGDVASRTVTLAEGANFDLNLEARHSPHEWLSWQQYLGNVPPIQGAQGERRATRSRGKAKTQLERADRFVRASSIDIEGKVAPGGPPAPGLPPWPTIEFIGDPVAALRGGNGAVPAGAGPAGAAAWQLLVDEATGRDPVAALSAGVHAPVPHVEHDDLRKILAVGSQGALGYDDPDRGEGNLTPRRYLIAHRDGGPAELACLPVPWVSGPDGHVPIEVLVRRQPLPGEAIFAMSPRDPRIGSALGYMGTGSLENARVVFDSAKELLFEKMMNPFGAAAGGYVLLATEHGPGEHTWHGWIENLSNWFDWLPDGMVQYGRLRLQLRKGEADIAAARTAFFAAFDRGLPVYSMGLQWLVDGLSLLASREDPEARRRLADVQEVVWRANLTQPFTTIRLRD